MRMEARQSKVLLLLSDKILPLVEECIAEKNL